MATREVAESARRDSDAGEKREPVTVYDLQVPVDRRRAFRRVPSLTYRALLILWEASRRHTIATIGLQVVAGVAAAVQLLVAREILQDLTAISNGASASVVYPAFALLVVVISVMGAITALIAYEQQLLVELVARRAFFRIIDVATSVELEAIETPEFHDQLERAKTSGASKSIAMVNSLTQLTTALVTSIGIGLVLAFIEPLLLVFVAFAAIPMFIATLYNSRASHAFQYAMTPESRERYYLVELLTGRDAAKELRVLGAGPHLRERFYVLSDERLRRLREYLAGRLKVGLTGTVASAVGTGLGFGALVVLLVRHDIDVANAVTAGIAMQQLASRFTAVTSSIGTLVESAMFVEDYNRFLELAVVHNEQEDDGRPRGGSRAFTGIVLDNVSFRYPTSQDETLHHVSLEVAPGEVVALVGENGAGKTTLVKLICQLYQPTSGHIFWNGDDASTLSAETIRGDMTVLFQDYIKYHLPVTDNIVLGRADRADRPEDVVAAARSAGADSFVGRLPRGYDTRLGLQFYGGHELSVGQWQRLALARAFFRGGEFVILDEPTASLDPRAERDLFVQMGALWAGKSVLLISHRFSSVRSANRIYVLEDGAITESGSHEELMRLGGQYAELFNLQAAAYLGEHS